MSPLVAVAVVGGGIAGLSAAFHLQRSAPDVDVTVFEAGATPGGKIRAATVAGSRLETGADAFLVRDDEGLRISRLLGMEDELAQPAVQGVDIWWDGRAHALPPGLVLGAPTRFAPLFGSDLISLPGALRAMLDLVLPRAVGVDRASVAELIGRRFGREVLDRLVDPLLSGIYAGDPARLGVAAATPRLAEAARDRRSLARGLRADPAEPAADGSIFRSPRGGMSQLVDRLAEEVRIRTMTPIGRIGRSGAGYVVVPEGGEAVEADGVVLAVPAYVAADLLGEVAPGAVQVLRDIPYTSVATVITVHEAGSVEVRGSGMLVPPGQSRVVKAISYVSNKWPGTADDGQVVLRSSLGRRDQEDPLGWSDDRLVTTVREDLSDLVDARDRPVAVEVTRWPRALPQYEPEHLDRIGRLDGALDAHPKLTVAGAAYRGVGVSACIRDGRLAAETLAGRLTEPSA